MEPSIPEPTPTVPPAVTKPKKKKKRKYSRGLQDIQVAERGVTKATVRVARAMARGLTTYRKRSRKSALKRRDGAMRDFWPNAAAGLSTTLRGISVVPVDLATTLYTKRARRRARRQMKVAARLLRPLGLR